MNCRPFLFLLLLLSTPASWLFAEETKLEPQDALKRLRSIEIETYSSDEVSTAAAIPRGSAWPTAVSLEDSGA